MKKIVSFFVLIILGNCIYAQQLQLDELATPSTPAFTLLGLSPTNVSRPTLSKPFFMSLANGLNGSSIASDVAVETTPYWWVPRPGLTYKKYYGLEDEDKSSGGFLDQVARSFALSVATSDASPDIDSINSRFLAAGLRFQVLNGEPSREFARAYEGSLHDELLIREAVGDLKFKVNRGIIATMEDLEAGVAISVQSIVSTNSSFRGLSSQQKENRKRMAMEYIREFMLELEGSEFKKESIVDFLEKKRGEVSDKVNELLTEMQGMSRVGWLLEFSGAASLLAPTNDIEYTLGQDWAGWATLTYRWEPKEESDKINDFNMMTRVGGNFQNSDSYNTDLGLSWVLAEYNYSLTLEGIFRSYRTYIDIIATDGQIYEVPETDNTWRFALAYQYKLSDVINISLAAGKDFENSVISAGGFFSLLNLNFSLPSREVISVDN